MIWLAARECQQTQHNRDKSWHHWQRASASTSPCKHSTYLSSAASTTALGSRPLLLQSCNAVRQCSQPVRHRRFMIARRVDWCGTPMQKLPRTVAVEFATLQFACCYPRSCMAVRRPLYARPTAHSATSHHGRAEKCVLDFSMPCATLRQPYLVILVHPTLSTITLGMWRGDAAPPAPGISTSTSHDLIVFHR